jgi:hypothetical protein
LVSLISSCNGHKERITGRRCMKPNKAFEKYLALRAKTLKADVVATK